MKFATKINILIVLAVVLVGSLTLNAVGVLNLSGTEKAAAPVTNGPETTTVSDGCPTDGITTIQLAVKNNRNATADYLAQLWQIYKVETGTNVGSVTSTAGASQSFATSNVDCGESYKLYPVSEDDANSVILGVIGPKGLTQSLDGVVVSNDGRYITVDAKKNNVYVTAVTEQHSDGLQVLAYDEKLSGWIYAAAQSSATTAQALSDGGRVDFYTTTSNSTALAVGTGTTVKQRYDIKTGNSGNNSNDRGIVMAIDVGTEKTSWDEAAMVVKVNGQQLTEVGSSALTKDEQDRYNGEEWFFIIPQSIVISNADVELYIEMQSKSDKNPTTNITTTLGVRGQWQNTGLEMVVSAAKDDASDSAVVSEWKIRRVIS